MTVEITLREFIAGIFLAGGAFFLLASAIGMLRLPDFYCRMHASGNSETLGVMLSFLGLVVYEGLTLTSLKLILIFLLIFLAMAVLQAAPQISWADMDVSFKAGWTNSGPQNYGTSSSVVLTLTSTGTSDVIVRRVTMNGGQDISAKCTNVTIPCRMPPKSSLLFTLPEGTRISEITIVTDGGPLTMRYK